ncbi:SDR family NAD(P)-dependent oxidoreductase [Streptomyces profundus]|uniref:SDR family NAD(P)-dependent oxidoreductase n=1 Tax=Streptomyces profundus TaxID=2867410 RepID=UPI001D161B01|nr:SDR family oxidoreductase [Streptomyces sp. MA3_2.13]UED88171.1 SDR family oxidoreductase [Streptomyces sp. MA3_2.13]
MNGIEGRTAFVTGGSRGIGAAVAVRLAECGADVVLTYRSSEERAAEVVGRIERAGVAGLAIRVDSADPVAVTAAVDEAAGRFGRLDILVNNAGVFPVGPIEDLGEEEFNHAVAVNVRAPFLASRAAVRHFTDGGRIISIGSNVAGRTVFPGFTLYGLSKSALVGMTKGLARELGPRGITVNLVQPGATDTEANPADGPNAAGINAFTALGRFADASDIAATVVHLAGVGGRYITGATLDVDGGFNT